MGASKHLDALEVYGVDIEIAPAEGHRLLVHVQRDTGRGALLGGNRYAGLLGGAAANVEFLLAWAVASADDVGQKLDIILERLQTEGGQRLARHGLHRNGYVLGAGRAPCRSDDHLLDSASRASIGGRVAVLGQGCGTGDGRRNRYGQSASANQAWSRKTTCPIRSRLGRSDRH